ncbi:MAG TPA: hypothetical protein VGJ20_31070 [Xanthobacteraceae bacterium]
MTMFLWTTFIAGEAVATVEILGIDSVGLHIDDLITAKGYISAIILS